LSSTAVLTTPFMMQGSFSHPGGVETPVGTGVVTTRWLSAPARLRRRGTSNLPAMSSRRRLPCRNRAHSCLSRPALPQLRGACVGVASDRGPQQERQCPRSRAASCSGTARSKWPA
jgi:hypothetical protein